MKNPSPIRPDRMPPSKLWRTKYECKKNKGDHIYNIVTFRNSLRFNFKSDFGFCSSSKPPEDNIPFTQDLLSLVTWECMVCNKRHTEHIGCYFGSKPAKPDKKMDKHRVNIYLPRW